LIDGCKIVIMYNCLPGWPGQMLNFTELFRAKYVKELLHRIWGCGWLYLQIYVKLLWLSTFCRAGAKYTIRGAGRVLPVGLCKTTPENQPRD